MDPAEFLWSIRKEERFNEDFASTPGDVAYHAPCHLRAQAVGFKGRDLIRRIPGVTPSTTMECCGHDGTYAVKAETHDKSVKIARPVVRKVDQQEPDYFASDCPMAATHIANLSEKVDQATHPMTLLRMAYGL